MFDDYNTDSRMQGFYSVAVILSLVFFSFSTAYFPLVEYFALWDLYNSTHGGYWIWQTDTVQNGIPWEFVTSDIDTVNPCLQHWQGVSCGVGCVDMTSNCTVESLVLSSYNLTGILPWSIGNLTNMKELEQSTR